MPMPEVWLRTNRRALAIGLVLPGCLLIVGVAAVGYCLWAGVHWAVSTLAVMLALAPLWMIGELLYAMTQPRLAYEAGELLVYLEPTRPTRVPIEIVECFFLGQGASELPKLQGREPETQNIIVRLAESAVEWKHRDVKPALGHWYEGYITLRGSWCEPIDRELMRRLNQRLVEVQRERKAAARAESVA
jgi:hypothetical protein